MVSEPVEVDWAGHKIRVVRRPGSTGDGEKRRKLWDRKSIHMDSASG